MCPFQRIATRISAHDEPYNPTNFNAGKVSPAYTGFIVLYLHAGAKPAKENTPCSSADALAPSTLN